MTLTTKFLKVFSKVLGNLVFLVFALECTSIVVSPLSFLTTIAGFLYVQIHCEIFPVTYATLRCAYILFAISTLCAFVFAGLYHVLRKLEHTVLLKLVNTHY